MIFMLAHNNFKWNDKDNGTKLLSVVTCSSASSDNYKWQLGQVRLHTAKLYCRGYHSIQTGDPERL